MSRNPLISSDVPGRARRALFRDRRQIPVFLGREGRCLRVLGPSRWVKPWLTPECVYLRMVHGYDSVGSATQSSKVSELRNPPLSIFRGYIILLASSPAPSFFLSPPSILVRALISFNTCIDSRTHATPRELTHERSHIASSGTSSDDLPPWYLAPRPSGRKSKQ